MNGAGPRNNPAPRVRISAVAGAVLALGSLVAVVWSVSPAWLPLPALPAIPMFESQGVMDMAQFPAAFTRQSSHYEVVAQATPPDQSSVVTGAPAAAASLIQAILPQPPAPPSGPVAPSVRESPRHAQAAAHQGATAPAPPKPKWTVLAKAPEGRRDAAPVGSPGALPLVLQEDGTLALAKQAQRGRAEQGLIKPALWEIPAYPLRTIYRSQTMTGVLLQAVHSDLPGQFKIQLTWPVLDKFGHNTVILPIDTIVIAVQDGIPTYGNTRLKVKLEQLELPTGEVVSLKASVGDGAGANGLTGTVNNHYGKLLLATGISALLNIGVKSLAGTPGPQQFYRNPAQDAAQDIGASVQHEATRAVDRELRVPPTITRQAWTVCTIHPLENLTFSRPPVVVK